MEITETHASEAVVLAPMPKKDYLLGLLSGFLIGLLSMPVLSMAKPDLYATLKLALIPFFTIGAPLGLIVCHVIARKIPVIWQLAKFVVTGVLNLLVDFGTLSIVTILFRNNFHINSTDAFLTIGIVITFYTFYKAISFTVANINSYYWNKYWTFDRVHDKKNEFVQFFTVSIVGFVINVVAASLVFNYIPHVQLSSDQWALIGAACGSIAGLAWNFLGYKFIVFKK
jgi:putative flippase GtrA